MNYWENISLASFILGGISFVTGIFYSFYLYSIGSVFGNEVFYFGAGLLLFFWVIAIGIHSYKKGE